MRIIIFFNIQPEILWKFHVSTISLAKNWFLLIFTYIFTASKFPRANCGIIICGHFKRKKVLAPYQIKKHWCYAHGTFCLCYISHFLSIISTKSHQNRHCEVKWRACGTNGKRRPVPIHWYHNHNIRRLYDENLARGGNHPLLIR